MAVNLFCKCSGPGPSALSLALGALLGVAAGGCSAATMSVRYDVAPTFDAAKYQRYHLLRHPVAKNATLEPMFERAVHRALARRGYKQVQKSEADIVVTVKLLVSHKAARQQVGGVGAGAMAGSRQLEGSEPSVEKTLLVILQEAQSHRIVWVGWTQMRVNSSELEAKASEAVVRIMMMVPRRRT